ARFTVKHRDPCGLATAQGRTRGGRRTDRGGAVGSVTVRLRSEEPGETDGPDGVCQASRGALRCARRDGCIVAAPSIMSTAATTRTETEQRGVLDEADRWLLDEAQARLARCAVGDR